MEYNDLVQEITVLVKKNKGQLYQTINHTITFTYWKIGEYLVEFEQKGNIRAEYGKKLLQNLSKDLTQQFGRGYSYRNLRLFRQFYITYSNWQTVIANSDKSAFAYIATQLSWSHLVRIMTIKTDDERSYYLQESIENYWSVRDLDRQIESALYERQQLSIKKITPKNTQGIEIQQLLKDPYIFEFLGIKEHSDYTESDIEKSIINNLERFLLELGKGFSFVSRQKRISSDSDHFYIDLVFYNRLLKCHVLIDLKIGKLKHQDIGQMQMYVNYFDREIKTDFENPTIGIILCKEKNDFVVEYSLPKDNKQIYPKEYQLYLPDKKELKNLLKKYI